MATNKTIQPTNVTVQIPAMTDAPDMSVPANAIDKAIDGINALNSKLMFNKGNIDDTALNNLTQSGVYAGWITFDATCPGKGQWCFIFVHVPSAGYCMQTIISAQTSAILASRYNNNGTWTEWHSPIKTGTMVIPCNAGKTQISYANLPSGKPDSQGKFLQSLYQCVNHGSAAEMTTVCIDGVDLIIQTATAQNVTIRWFYFGTVV